jgi:hypothetical protein
MSFFTYFSGFDRLKFLSEANINNPLRKNAQFESARLRLFFARSPSRSDDCVFSTIVKLGPRNLKFTYECKNGLFPPDLRMRLSDGPEFSLDEKTLGLSAPATWGLICFLNRANVSAKISLMKNDELRSLETAVYAWCDFLRQNGFDNFSSIFESALISLKASFSGADKERYEGLLGFQDRFNGGMGSINDLPVDDSNLRRAVETERDLLIRKYYRILYSPK